MPKLLKTRNWWFLCFIRSPNSTKQWTTKSTRLWRSTVKMKANIFCPHQLRISMSCFQKWRRPIVKLRECIKSPNQRWGNYSMSTWVFSQGYNSTKLTISSSMCWRKSKFMKEWTKWTSIHTFLKVKFLFANKILKIFSRSYSQPNQQMICLQGSLLHLTQPKSLLTLLLILTLLRPKKSYKLTELHSTNKLTHHFSPPSLFLSFSESCLEILHMVRSFSFSEYSWSGQVLRTILWLRHSIHIDISLHLWASLQLTAVSSIMTLCLCLWTSLIVAI